MTLIDDINRLFEELIRDPWSRARARPERPLGFDTHLDLEMPMRGGQLGDVSVSLRGRQLTVRTQRLDRGAGASDDASLAAEDGERTWVLPEDADVSGIEARVAGDVLLVRVRLRSRAR